jgi:predicted helicase
MKVTPEEIFYYIYAILYSDIYRNKYQEFLKIDFPRIPFTEKIKLFQRLSELGKQIVNLHLLNSPELNNPIAKYYGEDSNTVEKPEYKESENNVYINNHQYFGGIKPEVWNYYIGGYHVLNKWLKDRRGRALSSEDIKHYCKIVTAISKTIIIQNKIDEIYPEIERNLIAYEKEQKI